MKNRILAVQGAEVSVTTRHDQDYISLTEMVRNFDGGGALIEQWLKNKDTVLFLGVWELLNNPGFNSLEFEGIKNEAGHNSFFLSAKKWIAHTGAIGLHARAGWKANVEHLAAQEMGKREWYENYELRVAKVERAYGKPAI